MADSSQSSAIAQVHRERRGYVVETGCPGCGGAVTLERNFGTERCKFCGSLLRIELPQTTPAYIARERFGKLEVRAHLDRYLKQNGLSLTTFDLEVKGVYLPYWHVAGLLLKLRRQREARICVDQSGNARNEQVVEQQRTHVNLTSHSNSVCALRDAIHAPASLGLRTGNLILRPLVEEHINNDFALLTPQLSSEQAVHGIERQVENLNRVAGVGASRSVSKFFGESMELIHMPYFLCKSSDDDGTICYLMDSVTGRIETEFRDASWLEPEIEAAHNSQYGSVSLSLHRCRSCGEDLPDSAALLVICSNCASLTTLDNGINPELELTVARPAQERADIFLPFWVFELPDPERARLKHVFGSLDCITSAVVPAFEVKNSEALHRTIVRASLSFPKLSCAELGLLEGNFLPAIEPVDTSRARLQASYLRAQLERTNHLVENDRLRVGALTSLLYLPFRIESYFLVDSHLNAITVEKAAVMGRARTAKH